MDASLLSLFSADIAVTVVYLVLMVGLAAVSRHPCLGGGIRYAAGLLSFTIGSSLFTLMMSETGFNPAHRPSAEWVAIILLTAGSAVMVNGIAHLLEHPKRKAITRICWTASVLLIALSAIPIEGYGSMQLASELTYVLLMLGHSVVLLYPHAKPYRLPALTAGIAASTLGALYLVAFAQAWTGIDPGILPPQEEWLWLDFALWDTISLCVIVLASFRALTIFVRRSRTDVLTNCLNRGGFEDELALLAIRLPTETPITALALDIDHFKTINDRFGHAAGDAYIKRFAHVVQSCARHSDLVARVGGEEFVALLVDAAPESGERVAAKILQSVRQMEVEWEGERLATTVSIGVASGRGLPSIDTLLRRADRALYDAKRSGRDRVSLAGAGDTHGAGTATAF